MSFVAQVFEHFCLETWVCRFLKMILFFLMILPVFFNDGLDRVCALLNQRVECVLLELSVHEEGDRV